MKTSIYILFLAALFSIAFLSCSDENLSGQDKEDVINTKKESVGKTNDGHDLVVFNKGDLDLILFKIDTVYITDTSFLGRLHFKNLPIEKTPNVGDIINSTTTKVAPYGFLYRITDISEENDNVTIISVGYASIAEAVEEADIEFFIDNCPSSDLTCFNPDDEMIAHFYGEGMSSFKCQDFNMDDML